MNINDKDYEEISSTAIVTSYPRIFTDIPYEKEIYECLEKNSHELVTLNKKLAPEIEARYKLANQILDKYNIKQVFELAAGYTSRGLIYSKKGYNYVEMDLDGVSQKKCDIIKSIVKEIPETLHIISGNALRINDYKQIDNYFNKEENVAVLNEGLLRYLTFAEKKKVSENIYSVLKQYGGIWITCDCTPKNFITVQDKVMPDINKNLNNITSRNDLNDRFKDINHVKDFFGEIGFNVVEVHKFSEVKNDLYSMNYHGITDEHIDQLLENGITIVLKIAEN